MKSSRFRLKMVIFIMAEIRLVHSPPAISAAEAGRAASSSRSANDFAKEAHFLNQGGSGIVHHTDLSPFSQFRPGNGPISKDNSPSGTLEDFKKIKDGELDKLEKQMKDRERSELEKKNKEGERDKPEEKTKEGERDKPEEKTEDGQLDELNEKPKDGQLDEPKEKTTTGSKGSADEKELAQLRTDIGKLATKATEHETEKLKALNSGDHVKAAQETKMTEYTWNEYYKLQETLIGKGGGKYDPQNHPEFLEAHKRHTATKASMDYTDFLEHAGKEAQEFSKKLKDAENNRAEIDEEIRTASKNLAKKHEGGKLKEVSKIVGNAISELKREEEAIMKYQKGDREGATRALQRAEIYRKKFKEKSVEFVREHGGRIDPLENSEYQLLLHKIDALKGKAGSTSSRPNADELSHGIEAGAAQSKSWVLPILHPDGKGDPKSTVDSWNLLPWETKLPAIQKLTMRDQKPKILEERLARIAVNNRFEELVSKTRVNPSSVSREDWFNLQIASKDLKVIEDKRSQELAKLREGSWGKTFRVIGKVFWPLKFAWRMLRAAGRTIGYWLLRHTDPGALTPYTRLMLYDRQREVSWLGKVARALGGNSAGWIGRKQPQGNAFGFMERGLKSPPSKSAMEAPKSSKVSPA